MDTESDGYFIDVLENPVINKLAFEGNHAVEDKDLTGELELKPRSVYTRTKLQADVKRMPCVASLSRCGVE